jgi:hypothetical protein
MWLTFPYAYKLLQVCKERAQKKKRGNPCIIWIMEPQPESALLANSNQFEGRQTNACQRMSLAFAVMRRLLFCQPDTCQQCSPLFNPECGHTHTHINTFAPKHYNTHSHTHTRKTHLHNFAQLLEFGRLQDGKEVQQGFFEEHIAVVCCTLRILMASS